MNTFMEGIEILNQTEIMQPPIWAVMLFIACFIVTCISCFIFVLAMQKYKDILAYIFGALSLISVVGAIVGLFCTVFIEEPTGTYTYDCLISEDVSMTEFYEKYEVIKVNGQIWTIKEK